MSIYIKDLNDTDVDLIDQLANILFDCFFDYSPDWLPTLEDAIEVVQESFDPGRRSRILVDEQNDVLGWIGAFEDDNCWEIHPIVVAREHQRKGYGELLINDIAAIARASGAVALWAGTSDEVNATSLSGADLYNDPFTAIKNLTAEKNHPVNFWRKAGFTLVGVIPDEEGLNKPGIHFAKRII